MARHSKAPWTTDRPADSDFDGWAIVDAEGYFVAGTSGRDGDGEEEANAELMADAPALLEATKFLLDYVLRNWPPTKDQEIAATQGFARLVERHR